MLKIHDVKTAVFDGRRVQYFWKREKNTINGAPRYRVYIIDNDAPAVYETIITDYRGVTAETIERIIAENGGC